MRKKCRYGNDHQWKFLIACGLESWPISAALIANNRFGKGPGKLDYACARVSVLFWERERTQQAPEKQDQNSTILSQDCSVCCNFSLRTWLYYIVWAERRRGEFFSKLALLEYWLKWVPFSHTFGSGIFCQFVSWSTCQGTKRCGLFFALAGCGLDSPVAVAMLHLSIWVDGKLLLFPP